MSKTKIDTNAFTHPMPMTLVGAMVVAMGLYILITGQHPLPVIVRELSGKP
jgi:hypothetical protein